jgi:site-specific recombinase XerD
MSQASEEDLGVYRASLSHMKHGETNENYASSTVNLRVVVPALFHEWAELKEVLFSPLGNFLARNPAITQFHRLNLSPRKKRSVATVRKQKVIRRLPTALSVEQVSRILRLTPMPQRLMLKWCLATGMRRMEVANLKLTDIPSPGQVSANSDGLCRLQIMRKGGYEHTVHVPNKLIEETNWFVLTDRRMPSTEARNRVFINKVGGGVSRQVLTRAFRKSADSIGTSATLHHLRHTFAVHVLSILERRHSAGEELNSIKTLQILLGHASVTSTEIYLQAMQTSSDAVMEALDYLYGANL